MRRSGGSMKELFFKLMLQLRNAGFEESEVVHSKMLLWEYTETPMQYSKLLHEVQVSDSQSVAETYQSSSEDAITLLDAAFNECRALKTQGIYEFCRTAWDQRPSWMRTVYSGKEGDHTLVETAVNVATSVPFVLVGLQVPRNNFSTSMYANSLIGVGMASTLYHTSRGEVRKCTRWGDYAMIATSTLCMSSAVVLNKDNKQSKALILASIAMLPFQPLLVAAIHTSIVEAEFARKAFENPKLRGAHAVHTATSLIGGALFVADDIFPDTPFIHAAWHCAAAVGVMTINSLIE
ncbi:hypothetical protein M758_3G079000 [Ceratodon purpureus]|uniref:Uncharacterized protein n=1 Tax=Ceratodon purpureus TaxID=3225 RepID=A0A8T0IIJ9_CERPU|nr:hypothetical protein KC19_3G077900 [Ceratodon purpureus]KAG0622197.1 hypothetical protein M758_3G079000 [Ceratodon purpureus]